LIGHGDVSGLFVPDKVVQCGPYAVHNAKLYCVDDQDTQQDIANISGLTYLLGPLIIYNTKLQSLDFLSTITSINGSLIIEKNSELVSIASQPGVRTINGLKIANNPKLTDLSGLDNINAVSSTEIYDNASLTSLSGFSVGATVDSIKITSNPNLQDLVALNTLTTVKNYLSISNNGLGDLTDLGLLTSVGTLSIGERNIGYLTGLENLQTIDKHFGIVNCSMLKGFDGLNATVSYTDLHIAANPLIQSLNTLPVAPATMEVIYINDNALLTDLSALANVSVVNIGLYIANNPVLPNLQGLENLAKVTSYLQVADNGALTSTAALAQVQSVGSLDISRNASLTTLGMSSLGRVDTLFTIQDNTVLCEQDAIALKDQVLGLQGIGPVGNTTQGITVSGNNQACP